LKFSDLDLAPDLLEGIDAMRFIEATPIQEQAIPEIMNGRDLVGSAQTGTGKTGAFLIPVINDIIRMGHDDHIKALIVVPTRELAIQIDQQIEGLSYFTTVSSVPVYGGGVGELYAREKNALTTGADIVVCTPGRMMAHLKMGYVKFDHLKYLILDEADRMLDMGFYDDIMKIISSLPEKRQTLLFSATMPPKIRSLANKVLHDPAEINIAISKPPDRIMQVAFVVYDNQKPELVKHLLKAQHLRTVIVFCSKKINAKALARDLKRAGMNAEDIHSDLEQKERNKVLTDFKNRDLKILVATDIMSRGIDVEDIDLVINYDVPNDAEDYIHRIGRTARAASKGVAFTFINEQEQSKFSQIEALLGKQVDKAKLPEHIGAGPEYKPRKFDRERPKGKYKKFHSRKKHGKK
jgi:superfamily II DNA/RNA helicase